MRKCGHQRTATLWTVITALLYFACAEHVHGTMEPDADTLVNSCTAVSFSGTLVELAPSAISSSVYKWSDVLTRTQTKRFALSGALYNATFTRGSKLSDNVIAAQDTFVTLENQTFGALSIEVGDVVYADKQSRPMGSTGKDYLKTPYVQVSLPHATTCGPETLMLDDLSPNLSGAYAQMGNFFLSDASLDTTFATYGDCILGTNWQVTYDDPIVARFRSFTKHVCNACGLALSEPSWNVVAFDESSLGWAGIKISNDEWVRWYFLRGDELLDALETKVEPVISVDTRASYDQTTHEVRWEAISCGFTTLTLLQFTASDLLTRLKQDLKLAVQVKEQVD